ncbi:MAG: metal-dependent hydrolase [Halobacteriota archaeon]
MYTLGHVGISLLLYAPIAAWFLSGGATGTAIAGGVLMVVLSTLPDLDEHTDRIDHRGPTHTVWFAFGVGLFVAAVAGAIAVTTTSASDPTTTAIQFGLLATLGIFGHLAGDVITPMGVKPLSPVSEWHYTFDLTPAKNPTANRIILGTGLVAIALVGLVTV